MKMAAEKALSRKGGKLYVFFADLKAAFDKVDRKKLWKRLKEAEINEGLIRRIEDLYRETTCRIKIGEKITNKFWTERGLRQGCPLRPLLFILFIADIEKYLKARREGGTVIGKKKIYILAYADDLGAIAETEEEMKSILKSLEKYFDRRELLLNAEKSKIMVFCKREKRMNRNWKWKGESIEEVREFKYLSFTFMKNNKDEAHIKEIKKRAAAAMAQIWDIGERKFGGDVDRRIMMFNILIKSICMG